MNIEQFRQAAGVSGALAESWFTVISAAMAEFQINTPERQAAFIAQVGTESAGFSKLAESLNYSVEGLRATFPTRVSLKQAMALGRQPGEKSVPTERQMKIADLVYGGRYGNSVVGDGWKYRGRGLIHTTFHDNYRGCGKALGLDLVNSPELLRIPVHAARSAGWYWMSRGCNAMADEFRFRELSKRINGGYNGYTDRLRRFHLSCQVLKVDAEIST